MSEEKNPPANIYEAWDFSEFKENPMFTNSHIVSGTPREFYLTFGIGNPPKPKVKPILQVVLTRQHTLELIMNLQSQLKLVTDQEGGQEPRKRI